MSPAEDTLHPLASNESPAGPSPAVIEAIGREAATLHRYPDAQDDRLRDALAHHLGRGVAVEHLFTACSGYEGLDLIARAFLREGDECITCPPTFHVYADTAALQRATGIQVRLRPDSFALDVAGVLAAITPRTRLVYLCNPNNPTGNIVPATDARALLEALPDHVVVVADEVYHQYVTRPDYPDSIAHVLEGRPLIVLHSFSKAYGLAGLRLGYGITRPDLAERIRRYRRVYHLSRLDLAAGLAALADQAHVRAVVRAAQESRRYLSAQLGRLGIRHWPSEANFVLFAPPGDAERVRTGLRARGVLVRSTDRSGLPGHLRVSTGTPEANEAFIAALREVIEAR